MLEKQKPEARQANLKNRGALQVIWLLLFTMKPAAIIFWLHAMRSDARLQAGTLPPYFIISTALQAKV